MSPAPWRGSNVERLRHRGDVRGLVRILSRHDWLVDSEGRTIDLEVGRRIEAVTALATMAGEHAEDGVIQSFDDEDARVRLAAVEALRESPRLRVTKALARAIATWRDGAFGQARDAAIQLLVELADELHAVEYAQVLVDDEPRSSLEAQEEASVRRLFAADSGPVAEIFADDLAVRLGEQDQRRQHVAWQTLVAMGTVSVPALIAALDDPDRRYLATTALGAVRNARAVTPLIGLLSTGDAPIRAAAAAALGAIRDPDALEALIRASGDPDADVRDAALDALDRMRAVILAMLGAAALLDGPPSEGLPAPGAGPDAGDRPQAGPPDHRPLIRRLLGR
jgi:HEAT repeat protein